MRASDALTAPLEIVSRRVDGAWLDATRTFSSYHHGNRLFLDSEPDPQRLTALFERYDRLFACRRTRAPRISSWCAPLERSIAAEFGGTPIDEAVGLLAPRSPPDFPAPAGLTLREYRDARDGNACWRLS